MALAPEFLAILVCPASRAPLWYFAGGERGDQPDAAFLFCPTSGLRYRIDDDVPVLLIEEATKLSPTEGTRLTTRAQELGIAPA